MSYLVAQMAACSPHNLKVVGSNPVDPIRLASKHGL